jgi:type VII secretion protein EccB
VIRIARAAAEEYFVVLARGVQRIGQVAADLIRFTDSQDARDIVAVAPDIIGTVPILDTLRVSAFPERAGVSNDNIVCARWRPGPEGANTAVLMGNSLPVGSASPVALAQDDRDGPSVDSVSIPRGRSVYVRSSAITGDGASAGALYFIDDSGVVFGLRDEDTAKHLGLTAAPVPAPWPVLARLPRGPEPSRDAASVARDSVAGPS